MNFMREKTSRLYAMEHPESHSGKLGRRCKPLCSIPRDELFRLHMAKNSIQFVFQSFTKRGSFSLAVFF